MAEYTVIEERKFKQIEWTMRMPECQHPDKKHEGKCLKPGEFDAPTIWGPWADLCADHILTDTPAITTIGYHRIPTEKP